MARPVGANADVTRGRILKSAARLFSERGPGSTSVRDVAKDAGVSLAMVHHYYGSKEELYRSCVDAMYAELALLEGEILAAAGGGATPKAIVERAVRTGYRFACAHREAVRLVMRGVVDSGELPADRREQVLLPFLSKAVSFLAGGDPATSAEARLSAQSAVFLVVRYALAAPADLAAITGLAEDDPHLDGAVEDHLVKAALALLGGVKR